VVRCSVHSLLQPNASNAPYGRPNGVTLGVAFVAASLFLVTAGVFEHYESRLRQESPPQGEQVIPPPADSGYWQR
jgi:hypothetical protein